VVLICVSGTCASCLLVDRDTQQVTKSTGMYNYDVIACADIEGYSFGQEEWLSPLGSARILPLYLV
jgi:hypothetical protein